jgi:hypothetical protein
VKITCPRCGNVVAEHEEKGQVHILSIRTWRRNAYTVEGTVEQLAAIRLTVQCGMNGCGYQWEITAAIRETTYEQRDTETRTEKRDTEPRRPDMDAAAVR